MIKNLLIEEFSPEVIIEKWKNIFDSMLEGKSPVYEKPTNYYFNNIKWIRKNNRQIKNI